MKIFNSETITEAEIGEAFKDVVVIPTETVYGLAARIDSEENLKKIYQIKGRPSDNPLIVHISNRKMLEALIDEEISPEYIKLMGAFWPGPLTLIFKAKSSVNKVIMGSAGNTVAVRMPRKKSCRRIIEILGMPLAAPSANTSGKPSPTCLEHVVQDLGEKVATYIDGGKCDCGLESTVVGCVDGQITLLRPGTITKEQIEEILGKGVVYKGKSNNGTVICPGTKYKHYSPSIPVYLFEGDRWHETMLTELHKHNHKVGFILENEKDHAEAFGKAHRILFLGDTVQECCKNCFSAMKDLEKDCEVIFIKGFDKTHEGLAIMDRFEKASTKIFK